MPPETAAQTADANNQPASTPASTDTLLTAPAPAQGEAAPQPAQPAAETAAGATDTSDSTDKPQGAPEEYAEFTAPEGVTFNPEVMTEFKAFAKEKGLSQEDAQKLADLGVKNAQQMQASLQSKIEQAQAQWAEASTTDKEFGGDNLTQNIAVAKRALDTFGSPELSAMLKESGLGNHPEIIRAFFRVGKAISEDKLVPGTAKPPAVNDPAKKMFPSMN